MSNLIDVKDLDFSKQEGKEVYWHSSAHILAYAVAKLYPNVQITIGPAIENGFYYDFDNVQIAESDLGKIEEEFHKITKEKVPFNTIVMKRDEAIKLFGKLGQTYKQEIIREIPKDEEVRLYWIGKGNYDDKESFVDLCRGPHVKSTDAIKAIKLTKISGAYWRGDSKNKMLTRLYGITFPSREELKEHITRLEEAKKRDHRILGQKLDLFVFSDLVGPGLPLYTPKGYIVRNQIVEFSRELQNAIGYTEVHTQQINKAELFKISGHYDKYKDDMLMVRSHYSDEEYFLKPMNCPQHTQIYASNMRSYRDLPLRYSDFANLYRDEKTGELSGLTRLRGFAQDDGHCFCRPDQIKQEFKNVLGIIKKALETYGMNYWIRLSLRDPKNKQKYLGTDEIWNNAEANLRSILIEENVKYVEAEGEAAFYGPKMDIMIKDALGREWQVSTIQLDFNMPMRFGLKYTDSDNAEKTPVMIHRAIIGSPDRFFGILLEHFAGKFPMWLSPIQVTVVPVADVFNDYAKEVADKLSAEGLRANADLREISMNKKIREHEIQAVNYILVVGEKEKNEKTVNARIRDTKEQRILGTKELLQKLNEEKEKRLLKSVFS